MGRIRQRVSLTLDPELYARAQTLCARIPDMSVSRLVDDFLAQGLPTLEQLVDAAEQGDEDAAYNALAALVSAQLVKFMKGDMG